MRKISEMYERSGGTKWDKKCSECFYFEFNTCLKYKNGEGNWNKKYVACKFWRNRKMKYHQISMFEVL